MRTLLITALIALPLPALAQDVVGGWECTAMRGEKSVTNALTLNNNAKYISALNIAGKTQGSNVVFTGEIKGRYVLDGTTLTTTPTKVKPTTAKVDGVDLMKDKKLKDMVEQQLSAEMSAMQGQLEITELTATTMTFGSGKGATICKRQ